MATKRKRARATIHVLINGKTPKTKRNQVTSIKDYSISSELNLTVNQSSSTKEIFDLVNDHHRNRNQKKKHRNKLFIVILLLLILLLIVGIIIGVILLIPRNQTKTTINSNKICVLRWNTSGVTVDGIVGLSGLQANLLLKPWDITFDSAGTLYITDRFNGRLKKLIRGAQNASILTTPVSSFARPAGITVDKNDNLYVADQTLQTVSYLNPANSSSVSIIAGITGSSGLGSNQLNQPHGINLDTNTNTLYIAEYSAHRIRRYLYNATSGTTVAGDTSQGNTATQLNLPTAVYFDSFSNSLYIANSGANNIVRWVLGSSNWTLSAGDALGIAGGTSMLLRAPLDVELDPMGNLYVADTTNQRIQFFPFGKLNGTTIAGQLLTIGIDSYTFHDPVSLQLDTQLNLYVVDFVNNRIQKFLRY